MGRGVIRGSGDGSRGGYGRWRLGFIVTSVLLEAGKFDRRSRHCLRATIQIINDEGYYLIVNYNLLSDART